MNHTLITITRSRRPGCFDLSVKPASGRQARTGYNAGSSPEEAAAMAVAESIAFGAPYMIFAPADVLAHIPFEIRRKDR